MKKTTKNTDNEKTHHNVILMMVDFFQENKTKSWLQHKLSSGFLLNTVDGRIGDVISTMKEKYTFEKKNQ